MAPAAIYSTPAVDMGVALAAAKSAGVPFDEAWQAAIDGLRRPTDRPVWVQWREALNETKSGWRAAYNDEDAPAYVGLRALVAA